MWIEPILTSWGEVGGRKRGREGETQKMRLWDIPSDLTDKNRTIRKRERAGTLRKSSRGAGAWWSAGKEGVVSDHENENYRRTAEDLAAKLPEFRSCG